MKQRILDVASDLFAERGYKGATIRDICAVVKCSIGTVYDHFANKHDLFRQAFRHRARQMEPHLLKALKLRSPSLRARALTSMCMHHQGFLRLLLIDDLARAGQGELYFKVLRERHALPAGRFAQLKTAVHRAAGQLWLDTQRVDDHRFVVSSEALAWTTRFFHDACNDDVDEWVAVAA